MATAACFICGLGGYGVSVPCMRGSWANLDMNWNSTAKEGPRWSKPICSGLHLIVHGYEQLFLLPDAFHLPPPRAPLLLA